MSTSTTTTTRKRKRHAVVAWEDIIDELSGLDVNKENLVKELQEFVPDASAFMALTKANQEIICEACQITGWSDEISGKSASLVSW
jgi:hypothetical protein